MKKHDWFSYEQNCGPLGIETFWDCRACGAHGGVLMAMARAWRDRKILSTDEERAELEPFFSCPEWCRIDLPDDCDTAQAIIKNHPEVCEFRKRTFEAERKKQNEFDRQVDHLAFLAERATRGEWWVNDYDGGICSGPDGSEAIEIGDLCSVADACYTATAHPDFILKIIAELRRLQKALSG